MNENEMSKAALRFVQSDVVIRAKFDAFLVYEREGVPEYGVHFVSYHHDGDDAFLALTEEEYGLLKPHEADLSRGNVPQELYAVEEGAFVDRCFENMDTTGVPPGFKGELIEWALC